MKRRSSESSGASKSLPVPPGLSHKSKLPRPNEKTAASARRVHESGPDSFFSTNAWLKPFLILTVASLVFFGIAYVAWESADRVRQQQDQQRHRFEEEMAPRGTARPTARGDAANPKAVARIRAATETSLTVLRMAPEEAGETMAKKKDPMTDCVPPHIKGLRLVQDHFVQDDTAESLRKVFRRVLDRYGKGGGSGPVSLVDLNLGVVSMGSNFISLHHALENEILEKTNMKKQDPGKAIKSPGLTPDDVELYRNTVQKIHRLVSEILFCENPIVPTFGDGNVERSSSTPDEEEDPKKKKQTLPYLLQFGSNVSFQSTLCADTQESKERARQQGLRSLFLASPSFFSAIRGDGGDGTRFGAKTMNDEYWHEHVDRDQYGSFAITTLLYLNTKEEEGSVFTFEGGNFEFGGKVPLTVEPRRGRLLLFTSGDEHPHWVAPVTDGTRFALTTAFTCFYSKAAKNEQGGAPSYLLMADNPPNAADEKEGNTPPPSGSGDALFLDQLDQLVGKLS